MSKALQRSVAVAVMAAAGFVTTSAGAAETIKMTVSAGHPAVFLWVKHLHESFIPTVDSELAKTGKYKIEWNEAYGSTVAKIGSELETIEQGISDMGIVGTVFHSAKMPLQNVTYQVPFGPADANVVTAVMNELHEKLPAMQKSWERYNQVYMGGFAIDNYGLVTRDPIKTVEDLKGKKIGGAGPNLNWFKGTGAVGVVGSLNTFYNDIKTGVYDGAIVFATAAVPAKLYEVAPAYTQVNFGAMYAGGVSVNKTRWDAFPAEVKAAFRAAAKVYGVNYLKEQTARVNASIEAYNKNGGKVEPLAPAERAKLAKMIPNPATDWLKLTGEKHLPGKDVLKAYMDGVRATGFKFARDFDKE
ncbi:MAG: C4-dicarboxylate TRAP transporter substrate-binding protein [Candidatus Eiseniibacteriota bacterium]